MVRIVAAAIKFGGLVCVVERPGRHHDVFRAMSEAGFEARFGPEQQGFVTDDGRFVGREEGRKIAEGAGQLIASVRDAEGVMFTRQHAHLFSEDVW